jgi:hypothetical protein
MRNWLKYVFQEEPPSSSYMLTRTPDHKYDGTHHLTFCATGTSEEMAELESRIKSVIGGSTNVR